MFKPMKSGAVERIAKDLENDPFVKGSLQSIPEDILKLLNEVDESFLQGYLAGMSYDMNAMSRIHRAMAEQKIAEAMQLKQFGNTILYLLSKRLLEPDFDFTTFKKEAEPEKGKLIVPGE